MMRSAAGPRRRLLLVVALAVTPILPVVSCSSDDDAQDTVLDQVAPTKADVTREAGIDFPASITGFKLVRIGAEQLDVTFDLPTADVDAFATGSDIELVEGERAITHASPLWDLAITGSVRSGSSKHGEVTRSVEVVPGEDDTSTVRLTLLAG